MAYTMYLDGVAVPVTPSKIDVKIANQNKTLNLIDGSEINILNEAGLSKVSFSLLLPNVAYPFATGGQNQQATFSVDFEPFPSHRKNPVFHQYDCGAGRLSDHR